MEVQSLSNNIFHENVKQETPAIMLKYEIMLVRSLLVQADTKLSPKMFCLPRRLNYRWVKPAYVCAVRP